jgi:hypothetical protein
MPCRPYSVWLSFRHRVDRVLSFFSSRPNWDSSTPLGECVPPLWSRGEGTLACRRGGGGVPIPTRGLTLWYSRCTVYVLCGFRFELLDLEPRNSRLYVCGTGVWNPLIFVYSQRRGLDEGSLQYLPIRLRRSLSQAGLIYRLLFTL